MALVIMAIVRVDETQKDRLLKLVYKWGYTDQVLAEDQETLIPNPVTKEQFFRQTVQRSIFHDLKELEAEVAMLSARKIAEQKVDNEIVIT